MNRAIREDEKSRVEASMEFRPRSYVAEAESHALPRSPAHHHPLPSSSSSSPSPSLHHQVEDKVDSDNDHFFDPLRCPDSNSAVVQEVQESEHHSTTFQASAEVKSKEWSSFKRFLMQRFPVSKTISLSSMASVIVKSGKAYEKSSTSTHLEELDDPQKIEEEGAKVITHQEYVSWLHELKDEIKCAWLAEDRVTSLKLCIKVARLLMDTSVSRFYPTLFVLATDILDMLGDMVWERIKAKAQSAEHGSLICSLPENFGATDVCFEAKETCNNWFCKVGSIRELLPRIYLEAAILPCWRFLLDQPVASAQRLVMMTRGLADPLASVYCRLYITHSAKKLLLDDTGYLITCVNDMKPPILRLSMVKGIKENLDEKKRLISLMEPAIEQIMRTVFTGASERQVDSILVELGLGHKPESGSSPFVSILLHHLLKQLPAEMVSFRATDFLCLIKCSNDYSFDQFLNYRMLGLRLCERRLEDNVVTVVINTIIEVLSHLGLNEYLKVVDAYLDMILQNQLDDHLKSILEGISDLAHSKEIGEDELTCMQSILLKILSNFKDLEEVFAVNHFLEILDEMHGSYRRVVNMHILDMAMRKGCIRHPTSIQLLFEISQALSNDMDILQVKNDENQQQARLINRFVQTVDHGADLEQHLDFLIECRHAFVNINEVQESLVHSSNYLAVKALKSGKKQLTFFKSCLAFSEVTIPSVLAYVKQVHLYLETAEVALMGGLLSHSNGLIASAFNCLQSFNLMEGSKTPSDTDGILSTVRKLCSLLVMVPGHGSPEQGFLEGTRSILSLVYSHSCSPRMKTRLFCAIVSLLATLCQERLPYHADPRQVLGNDLLVFGDSSYAHELLSLAESVLQNLVEAIEKEASRAVQGSMALEACNCIVSSFSINEKTLPVCSKLIETAKSCLSANDRHLISTLSFVDKNLPPSVVPLSISI